MMDEKQITELLSGFEEIYDDGKWKHKDNPCGMLYSCRVFSRCIPDKGTKHIFTYNVPPNIYVIDAIEIARTLGSKRFLVVEPHRNHDKPIRVSSFSSFRAAIATASLVKP